MLGPGSNPVVGPYSSLMGNSNWSVDTQGCTLDSSPSPWRMSQQYRPHSLGYLHCMLKGEESFYRDSCVPLVLL